MMRKLLIVFLFSWWCACSPPKKPEGVLTQSQLSALLIDIYLAEARLEIMHQPKDSSIRLFIPFEQKLLQAKGIPDSVMKPTYTYYLSHPKELEQVYDAVIDTLMLHDKRSSQGPGPSGTPAPIKVE